MKGRNVVRCTGWRTATCGALPAAGKRPARDSPTERLPANTAVRQQAATFSPENGGRGIILHAFGFLELKVPTVRQALAPALSLLSATQLHWTIPAVEGTKGQRSHLLHRRPGFPVLPSPFPSFPVLGNPSAAKQCKEKNRSKDLSWVFFFLMLGSVLHLSMFCKALVFKWKVLSKKGSRTKAKSFFLRFIKRKTFLSKRRMGLPLPFLKNCR